MAVPALYERPWAEAAHLAVVDSCGPGWDAGAAWIGAQIKIGKATALAAGSKLHAEGIYTDKRTERKKQKNGTWFAATYYTVSARWTTRNGKRNPSLKYVVLDTGFLDRNPRASELTKRVYHAVSHEQFKYGGCALRSADLAARLHVESNLSESGAERVGRTIRKLITAGELVQDESGIFAVAHPAYAVDRTRYRPDVIRASLAAEERKRIVKSLEAGVSEPVDHSEPTPRPLGTDNPTTRNHPMTMNDEEQDQSSGAARREAIAEEHVPSSMVRAVGKPLRDVSYELALTGESTRPLETKSDVAAIGTLGDGARRSAVPLSIRNALAQAFGHNAPLEAKAQADVANAWRATVEQHGGELIPAQLNAIIPYFLSQLAPVAAAAHGGHRAGYARLTAALPYLRDGAMYEELKALRRPCSNEDRTADDLAVDFSLELEELLRSLGPAAASGAETEVAPTR